MFALSEVMVMASCAFAEAENGSIPRPSLRFATAVAVAESCASSPAESPSGGNHSEAIADNWAEALAEALALAATEAAAAKGPKFGKGGNGGIAAAASILARSFNFRMQTQPMSPAAR